ncbi:MAG: hypothetical protein HYS12_10930 [Planctomycetes bacterium]|nr:hypothetical protein [Planctomycetota bacterium]
MTSRIAPLLFFAFLASGLAIARAEGEKEKKTSDPRGEVSGIVRLAGRELPAGMITFHGRDAKDTVRVTVDDGKYVARNVPAGKNIRVTIEVEPINALAESVRDQLRRSEERARLLKLAKADDEPLTKRIKELKDRLKVLEEAQKRVKGIKLPEAYGTKEKTPLKMTVESGKQTANFELKD